MALKGDDSKFSIATTVTLALAVAALVLVKEPLKSSRPIGAGIEQNGASDTLQVRARLWEDPFAAVLKDLEARKKNEITISVEGGLPGLQQDVVPHQAVAEKIAIKAELRQSKVGGLRQLRDELFDHANRGTTITTLIVMTAGGFYIDENESRIADRYAIEAALHVGCFAPVETTLLRYFTWQFNRKSSVTVPYEWHSRRKLCRTNDEGRADSVLVLWVRAEDYGGKVMEGLQELMYQLQCKPDQRGDNCVSALRQSIKDASLHTKLCVGTSVIQRKQSSTNDPCTKVRFRIVGPRYSSEFQTILAEAQRKRFVHGPIQPLLWSFENGEHTPIEWYSPWATAMPGLLTYELKNQAGPKCDSYKECETAFNNLLLEAGIDLRYRIDNDYVLFEELFHELDRRWITVGKDPIVLIGEWDSFYARALPITFSAAACRHITREKPATQGSTWIALINFLGFSSEKESEEFNMLKRKCTKSKDPMDAVMRGDIPSEKQLHIKRYSYLSGLDGESLEDQQKRPRSKDDDKGKEKPDNGKMKLRDIAFYEKPEGTSQLDYVRRLAWRIKSSEKGDDAKVKAIGILGRDPYDALLILQAMREQFPTVLFFTTDLYARYFHEGEQKWARNLLVVSHFGLQLEKELQQSIPPFRNSYQTSTFLAVLRSIGHGASAERGEPIPPRVFEIGRHGAVDLSATNSSETGEKVHPLRDDVVPGENKIRFPARIWILWIPLLVLLGGFVWSYGRLWNWLIAKQAGSKERIYKTLFGAAIVMLPVLCLFFLPGIVHRVNYAEDEPFSWSDGVSVWPTELLRLLVGVLCIWFMVKGAADLRENTKTLKKRFSGLADTGHEHGFWSNFAWVFHGTRQGTLLTIAELWTRYCGAHRCKQRAGRIALLIVLYLLMVFPIWLFMNDGDAGLFVPCRGTFSCGIDTAALFISVSGLLILNFYVFDSALLCARWITEMPHALGGTPLSAVRLIVERTRIINRRILYPFIALFIMVAARSHYFDDWDFPPPLIVALGFNSLLALGSASILYLVALKSRRVLVESLETESMSLIAQGSTQDQRSDRIRKVIDEIASIQQGAFVPLYQQPVVQATLVAALAFLQYWVLGQ
ncbi:hypothetical protein [Nitrospira sp. Nam80]